MQPSSSNHLKSKRLRSGLIESPVVGHSPRFRSRQQKKSSRQNAANSSGPWSRAEDAILLEIINSHGARQWTERSRQLRDRGVFRNSKQCRERFINHLSPDVVKTPWTLEEDLEILRLQRIHGNKWSKISRLMSGRSDNHIKNRWNTRLGKGNCDLVEVLDAHGAGFALSTAQPRFRVESGNGDTTDEDDEYTTPSLASGSSTSPSLPDCKSPSTFAQFSPVAVSNAMSTFLFSDSLTPIQKRLEDCISDEDPYINETTNFGQSSGNMYYPQTDPSMVSFVAPYHQYPFTSSCDYSNYQTPQFTFSLISHFPHNI